MTWSIIPNLDSLGSFKFMQLTNLDTSKQGNGEKRITSGAELLVEMLKGSCHNQVTITPLYSTPEVFLKSSARLSSQFVRQCSEGSSISIQTYYSKPAFTSLQTSEPWEEIADDKEEICSHMETIPCTLIG